MRSIFPLLLLAATVSQAEQQALQLEDVFLLNYANQPEVSPDGSFLVYTHNFMDIMEDRRRSNIWRIDVDGSNARPLTTGAVNDGGARIAPDNNRVAYVSRDDKGGQIFVRWLDSGDTQQLTRLPFAPGNLNWSPDGEWLAFSRFVPDEPVTMGEMPKAPKGAKWADKNSVVDRAVFRLDGVGELPAGTTQVFVVPASGGAPRQVTSGDITFNGAIDWARDGRSLYVTGLPLENAVNAPGDNSIYRVSIQDGDVVQITDRDGPENNVAVSPDGRRILFSGYDDGRMSWQRNRLYVANADGSSMQELLPDLDRSVGSPAWSSDGKGIYFQYDDKGRTVLAYTTLAGRLTVVTDAMSGLALSRPYTGATFAVGGRNTWAITTGDALSLANIATGRGTGDARTITDLGRNLLDSRALAPVTEHWTKSSHDGLDIQYWVARPADFDPDKEYPLLLEIHGGPHAPYGPHFSAEVQLFAAAGYVVVYANPRGSTSYGEEFAQTIHHNYPSEDYDDLMSVVDAVIADGSIDADQLTVRTPWRVMPNWPKQGPTRSIVIFKRCS